MGSLRYDPKDHPDYERWTKSAKFSDIDAVGAEYEDACRDRKYRLLEEQRVENVRLGLEAP